MDYVIIETGGKQYKAEVGSILTIDKVDAKDSVSFDKVLLRVSGDSMEIGKPYISGVVVTGKVLGNKKGNKIRVARFTAKSRHRRVIGFRPSLTRVQIEAIGAAKKSASEEKPKTTRKTAAVSK